MSKLKELAEMIGRLNYGDPIPTEAIEFARENRLVICKGHSDDIVEFDGAFCGEYNAYEGATIPIWPDMKAPRLPCDFERLDCPLYCDARPSKSIRALWCENPNSSWTFEANSSWTFEADVPTERFVIQDEHGVFCVGIVFSLDDTK